MQDTYENYIGKIIENERTKRGLSVNDVCNGICSAAVCSKLESGEYAGGIHILRALCQRLGINSDRCGTYLPQAEYDEMMDRLYILENIKDGSLDMAQKNIERYKASYKNIPLNNQFILFMNGRIAELDGKFIEGLELYAAALHVTMPEYENLENLSCITIYEAYMFFGIARISAKLGNTEAACRIYKLLISYCEASGAEKWNLVCIYPKAVCELAACVGLQNMTVEDKRDKLECCISALDMLKETARLYYIRPLLTNIIELNDSLNDNVKELACNNVEGDVCGAIRDNIKDTNKSTVKNIAYDTLSCRELLECVDELFRKYKHERELFEWYPYYVDSGFRCVNQLIDERRRMHGMSIEELAGTNQSARNVQRIVKGQSSPSYRTSKELLDKLGLKGVLRSDVIVADKLEAYRLWDELEACIKQQNSEHADNIIEQLINELDISVEINDIALKYIVLYWQLRENKITTSQMLEGLEKLLPFNIEKIGNYKFLIKHEKMILHDYIVCMDMMNKYDNLIDFDKLTMDMQDSLSKKQFAGSYEEACVRCANLYGNAAKYEISNKIAEDGIRIDVECERMRPLSTLLYCEAWNNKERGEVTENDIALCRCAYQIAKLNQNEKRMSIYREWLENR